MEHILEVDGLKVQFITDHGPVQVIRGISYHVNKEETLGIVGESGCGKSVSSLAVMGLLPRDKSKVCGGSIRFHGEEITHLKEKEMRKLRGNKISMVFQEPMTSLNPVFTIGDQLSQPLRQHTSMSRQEIHEQIIRILKLVEIPRADEVINQYPHELSGGMRQRVMISMAVICNPDLLIADEPTTALDVTIQAQILSLLKKIKKDTHMSMIFITHDLGVLAEVCDRIIVMYAGSIVEEAAVHPFFDHPKHPYSQGLLNSLPREDEHKQFLDSIKGNVPSIDSLPEGCPFANRCPQVMERCRKSFPPVYEVDGQRCRCWLYADAAGVKEGIENGK